ncbi:MAG: elongation factor G [Planctomycetaceae bacterium]|nr:MAG: elongation factor G [Planctomycetaceae bacterium]
MPHTIEQLRNIGIVAHIDAGKTTTTERILFYAGETHRMGEVDEGTTVTDFDPEEAKRGITIYSAAVTCRWRDPFTSPLDNPTPQPTASAADQPYVINIIDTPGHVDFTAEVERSLRVLDGAVVIFSAVEGVEAQSETVWRQADRYHVPRICYVNKLDRIGANFERVIEQMQQRLKAQPVVVAIPWGQGPATQPGGLIGIIDLIHQQLLVFDRDTQGQVYRALPIPKEAESHAALWRVQLLEAVAMQDEAAFAEYDAQGDIAPQTLEKVLRQATIRCELQPVLCGASLSYVGVQPLLDAVVKYLPSPVDIPPVEGKHPQPKKNQDPREIRHASPKEPVCGLVFKIQASQHAELCFVRIYSGVLKSRSRLLNPRTGNKEMITQLWKIQANSRVQLEQAEAGDIIGVVGPREVVTGDTLCDPQHPILLESIKFPETVISMAVEPETSADRKKLEDTLKLLAKQDPTFTARVHEETGQTIISGMGELHLEIIRNRMERDFGLKIRVHKPRVTYRETIEQAVEQTGVLERQAGGTALFAAVTIRLEPCEAEAAPVIRSGLKPGTIPPEWEKVILQTLQDESRGGGRLGYPLMHVVITLIDVQQRQGETNELALQAAAASAMREALHHAGTMLLEPIMKLEVVTPEDFLGNITADLNARRAVIMNTEMRGHLVVLQAEAPLSEMFGYSTQIRSLSQGRASYAMEPLRYAPAPPEVLREMLGLA